MRDWRARRPPDARSKELRLSRYGLSPEGFDALLAAQGGLCAICRQPPNPGRALHVDHDHGSGAVRGLLCGNCNVGLGHFRDSTEFLTDAINYLKENRNVE